MKIAILFIVAFASLATVASADTYDVYLLAGQSNMDGRGKASNLAPHQRHAFDNVIIFYRNPPNSSGGWKPLGPGYSIPPRYKAGVPSSTFGPELGFAGAMTTADPNRKLALIKGSKGGTSLRTDWSPGAAGQPETQGECYRNFCETIRLATADLIKDGHRVRLRGLLWHQGESDSKLSTDAYQKRLVQFIDRIREDIDVKDLPVVVGEVFDNGKRNSVRAALQAVGTSGPGFGLVSSEGTTTSDEGTHFDAASQILLGQRYAQAMLQIENANQQ